MLGNAVPSLLQHVRRLAAGDSPDEQLLADFLTRQSDEAFAALVGRHGPMVFNVCRRILHDSHAAEDVFQATFLVLADRAGAIRRRESLAGFLHGVAYRLAVRARRRTMPPLPGDLTDRTEPPIENVAWKEMLGILDQELGRLPDRYRAPLVLCYLEGRTQDEAARQLGWGLNTLRRRVAQGRRLLEARLRGRGVTLSAALAGLLAARTAVVPAPLRAATLAAVSARTIGGSSALLVSVRKGFLSLLSTSGKRLMALAVAAAVAGIVCCACCWDRSGDQAPAAPASETGSLPERTIRFGTDRYRNGPPIEGLAVSADGTLAVTRSPWSTLGPARVFDLTSGRCLYSLAREPDSDVEVVGLSPDGKLLATRGDRYLRILDAVTGKEIRKLKYNPGGGRSVTRWLTFTPDGKQLAVTLMGAAIRLLDVETFEEKQTFPQGGESRACVFSPDGKHMATGGLPWENKVYYARLWDVASGTEVKRFATGDAPLLTLAFSPDGATLAGGCQGDGRPRLWDVATGRERLSFPGIGRDVHSVVFAPDGKTLAAAGDSIHLYDPETGKERLRIDRTARGLAFNRDGSVLTGAVSGAIYQWDTASGRQLTPAGQDSSVEQLLGAGRRLFDVDQEGDLYAWDTAGGKPPRRIAGGAERGLVASRDGRFLAWVGLDARGGCRVQLYDVTAEQVVDRFPVVSEDTSVEGFLPDGKTLLTLDAAGSTVRLWDVESGKERRSFTVYPVNPGRRRPIPGLPYLNRRAALSPDGNLLAIAELDNGLPVDLWNMTTGKIEREIDVRLTSVTAAVGKAHPVEMGGLIGRRKLKGYISSGEGLAFSPDGRYLVTWSEDPFASGNKEDHVKVWDTATGRAVVTLVADRTMGASCVAFASDGRTLATASMDGVVRLWEVATWKVRAEFRGHQDRISALAFGPDGRLFSGGRDTVIFGWDVRPSGVKIKGSLAEAWDALAGADAKGAFQAQGRFLAESDRAVEWLATRVSPAKPADPAHVKALIGDLDRDDFATRERAAAELRELGASAAAALREALTNSPSAEVRRRAEELLQNQENGVIPPGELRSLRAVEVLEWIATPEARARLVELAKGAPAARITREAAASCKRLEGTK